MSFSKFLVAALLELHSALLDPSTAAEHVASAVEAARGQGRRELTPELLLAMAYEESRYVPVVATYVHVDGTRRGMWRSRRRPRASRPNYYCGVLGQQGRSWAACVRLMDDVRASYAGAARELVRWLDDPACKGRPAGRRIRCALCGYGGGYPAIRRGLSYPGRVLRRAAQIHGRAERAQARADLDGLVTL